MFKVNNSVIAVVLVSLLLTLNISRTLEQGVSIVSFEHAIADWALK